MAEKDYLVEVNNERSIFTFTDEALVTSVTVTPQYGNIKNDYIVQGLHQMTDSDISYPIRYHLAIDNKPRSIGRDPRATVQQIVDHSEQIAEDEDRLAKLQDKLKVDTQEYQLCNTNLERLNRIIEQRQVEYDQAQSQLMYILITISEKAYGQNLANNPEGYWQSI